MQSFLDRFSPKIATIEEACDMDCMHSNDLIENLQAFEMNSIVQKLPMRSHFGSWFFFNM